MNMRNAITEAMRNASIAKQDKENPIKAYRIRYVCLDDRSDFGTFICFDEQSRDSRLKWLEDRNEALAEALRYKFVVKVFEENRHSKAYYEHYQNLMPDHYTVD